MSPLPERVLELPLHSLHIRILDQEGRTQLAELSELNLPGAVFVNLQKEVFQLLLCRPEAHGPHDLAQVVGREELNLLGVEQVKTHLDYLCHYVHLHNL